MIKPDMEIVNWEQGRLVELEKNKKKGGKNVNTDEKVRTEINFLNFVCAQS